MPEGAQVYAATGKRKTAIARVRLRPGRGDVVVNRRSLEEYFPRKSSQMIVRQPFDVTQTVGQFDVAVNVRGGGISAQAEAVRHGIARALLEFDPNLRPPLKKAGFVRRDPREVERKKYGRHKARKRPQYSKR